MTEQEIAWEKFKQVVQTLKKWSFEEEQLHGHIRSAYKYILWQDPEKKKEEYDPSKKSGNDYVIPGDRE